MKFLFFAHRRIVFILFSSTSLVPLVRRVVFFRLCFNGQTNSSQTSLSPLIRLSGICDMISYIVHSLTFFHGVSFNLRLLKTKHKSIHKQTTHIWQQNEIKKQHTDRQMSCGMRVLRVQLYLCLGESTWIMAIN